MPDSIPPRPSGLAAIALTRLLRGRRPAPGAADAIADPARVRRLLVLKLHDQLGDFVLITPALRALRERFPSARIALVTREFLAPLARRTPFVDQVWVMPKLRGPRSAGSLAAVLWEVARYRPEIAWVMNSVSRSKSADALAALSGARLVVGRSRVAAGRLPPGLPANPEAGGETGGDPVYDLDLGFARGSQHQGERILDLVRWCAPPSTTAPELRLPEEERVRAWRAFEEVFPNAPVRSPRVGFHPGAANPLKCWPLESFVAVAAGLAGEEGAGPALVVFDSPRERGRGAALCAGLAARRVQSGLLPPGGIEWFAALCSHLDLLVCNDSGVMHIAAALGVPTVSLHSLGWPPEWAPRGDRAVALWAPADIASIPIAAVLEAARALLALRDASP